MMAAIGKRMLQGSFCSKTWQEVLEEKFTELCKKYTLDIRKHNLKTENCQAMVFKTKEDSSTVWIKIVEQSMSLNSMIVPNLVYKKESTSSSLEPGPYK